MADNIKVIGQDPTSANADANAIGISKDTQSAHCEETVVIYRSWFECLREQGAKKFAQAMVALLSFAFYGMDVKSHGLPRQLESILETFTPVIDTNRKKRNGGNKGKEFGKKGGRPHQNDTFETPKGLPCEASKGVPYNVNVNVTDNDNDNVNVYGTGQIAAHTDYHFFVFVFFFRNVQHPERQAKKFAEYYSPSNWRLPGGEYVATDAQRIALAQRWEIRDDTTDRFNPEDLAMWRELYNIAPDDIKPLMLANSVKFLRTETNAIIAGPRVISDWIERTVTKTKPIIGKWKGERNYAYAPQGE